MRLSKEKAQTVFNTLTPTQQEKSVVLGSDTSVVIDGEVLGKPANETQCVETLLRLEGKQHQVLTGIAVVSKNKKNEIYSQVIETQVQFKALTVDEIKRYWQTGEPCDKAGSYAIQGVGGQFVTTIKGSYSAVVGLPLYETVQLLSQAGLPSSLSNEYIKD